MLDFPLWPPKLTVFTTWAFMLADTLSSSTMMANWMEVCQGLTEQVTSSTGGRARTHG